MTKYTYLLINVCTIIIPLIASFHPAIRFYKRWKQFLTGCITVGIVFILWDAWFTKEGVWWFSKTYTTGFQLLGLPVEEWLFFICIPYACLFTYHCITTFYHLKWNQRSEKVFTAVFAAALLIAGALYYDRMYTSVTFISTAVVSVLFVFIAQVKWFGKAVIVYGILLLPFLIVNGILTGTGLENPVVFYNDAENMGIRILTIPLEDVFYGFELIVLNICILELPALNKKMPVHNMQEVSPAAVYRS